MVYLMSSDNEVEAVEQLEEFNELSSNSIE